MILKNTPFRIATAALLATSPMLLAEASSQTNAAKPLNEKPESTEMVLKLVEKENAADAKEEPADPKKAAMEEEKAELTLSNALATERSNAELNDLKMQVAKLKLEKELLAERFGIAELKHKEKQMADKVAFEQETRELSRNTKLAKMEAERLTSKLKSQQSELGLAMTEIEREMKLFKAKQERSEFVDSQPIYLANPLKEDGTLVISDRRIDLNGPIMMETATHVGERISYFNNKNGEHPIFIVIDSSPGGSVMSGMQILKAMHGSQAPVYVVVKSFAASMAAGITTLAERSFALPDAVLLHHQILAGSYGNLTETREHTRQMEAWWGRLAGPVAKKMGITLEEFIAKMYSDTVTGDWTEFADDAQKIKWVDTVVSNIQETSLITNPDSKNGSAKSPNAAVEMENVIPRLNPKDMLYLYNPDGYYKMAQ